MNSQATGSTSTTEQTYKQPFTLGRFARVYGLQLGILGVFLGLWIIFIMAAPDTFLSSRIYFAFMSTIPFFAIMAIPLTLVIIAREMDLSFPSIMGMGMVAFSFMYAATESIANVSTRVFLAFLAALISGALIGWLNGVIIVRFGIPSLVATIGTQFFWRGAVLVLTEGKNYSLSYIKETFLYPALVGKIGGYLPMQMIWLIVIAILGWALLNRHKFGAHIYLIGDNIQSAQLMGVRTGRVRIRAFMLVGLISAFAGVLYSFHIAYFWPSLGDGYLLNTLASVFLGGTSVFGGTGTILGTFLGSFIIGAIEAATVAVGLTGFWTQLIYGLIIVLSVIMHTYLRKRTE
ncbi:MAG TPA: ABC transporter permease [Anaerolineales bacterium]|nr:ABC transporter permease [Anaerolineales bacterium]